MNKHQTLLLVDDSENDRILMRSAFEKAGFNIAQQEVENGEEAVAYLQGDGVYADRVKFPLPSMMLLDLNMPLMDGFEVLTWVRAHEDFKNLPIIVMTASMRPADVQKTFDLGATSYLVKPINLHDLALMVRTLQDWTRINQFPPLNKMVSQER